MEPGSITLVESVRLACAALAERFALQPWAALVLEARPDDGRTLADQVRGIVAAVRPAGTTAATDDINGLCPTTPEAAGAILHMISSKDLAYGLARPNYDADRLDAAFVDLVVAVGPSATWWSNHPDPVKLESGNYAWTPLLWTTFDGAIVARGAGAVVVIAMGDED